MKYCVLSMKYIHILSTTVWCYGFHITNTVTDIATPILPNCTSHDFLNNSKNIIKYKYLPRIIMGITWL